MDKNAPVGLTYYSEVMDVAFYVLGTSEVLTESSINITNKEVLKGTEPMPEGIYDAHMGTTDHQWDCATCGNEKTVCPGHFGSIDLRYPIKSPLFRDELLKWLKVICYYCGSTVIPIKNVKTSNRLSDLVKNVRQVKQCTSCKQPHMQVVRDKKRPAIFYRVQEEGKIITSKTEFYNHTIEQVLQRITDSTVMNMGYPLRSHPAKYILRSIKASPNTTRPDVRRINGARSSNPDTTSLLKQIIEINDALPEEMPAIDKIGDYKEMYFNLDMTCFAMIKGGGGGDIKILTNTNKPPVAIAEHWPKKSGRIRSNLMGKRVEYMIRSVITGDSRLKINEVGIPISHARNLEIPETVSDKNMSRLLIYYNNKTERYPGCKRIIKKINMRTYRTEKLADYQLQIGDVVFRDMIDGDYINFNRQPTLIFSSIAGLRVVIMHIGDTLRINPSVCKMFNADFDGDNMNCMVPSGIQARNECMTLSNVSRWVISPQNQAPMIGAFQDAAIGLSELTKDGLVFNKWHAMNMLADIETSTIDYKFTTATYTNRELVSRLLPKINVINKEPTMYKQAYEKLLKYNHNDIKVNIIRGKLISGVLDKSTVGEGVAGSIFHVIANEYGNNAALETVYNLQQIVHSFFLYHGFTVGISDINISDGAMKEVKRRIASMIIESRKITQRLNNNKLIPPIGMSLYDFNEAEQMNALTNGDDFVDPIFADIDLKSNMMARLILSGSKGKVPNFIDLNGALGVLTINGKRFGPQAGWGRTSCYFTRYDTDPAASGFIAMCYREGVSNDVYPFVAGQARHGAISNALSTSITGYQNRISIKNLESILVDNLRASSKGLNIIQPLYAECGLDPAKMEKVKFPTALISDDAFVTNYKTSIKDIDKKFQNAAVEKLLELEFEQLTADRLEYRSIFTTLEDHNPKEYVLSDYKQMPVNLNRIIDDTIYNYAELVAELKESDKILNIIYVIESVKNLCSSIGYVYLNEIQQRTKKQIPHYIKTSTTLMLILIRSYLSTAYLLKKQVTNQLLDIIIQRIITTYKKALIDYGTSVGILAAQCISEPMTQYVLDSKHRSGGQGGTKTNAIVRLQEILGAKDTETMKNPHMLIMVKPEFELDKLKVQEIANHIEMMNFDRFVSSVRIFFEEYGKPTHPLYKHEAETIAQIAKHNYGQKIPADLIKWCIRYTLNKEELILKSMKLETIILAIRKAHPELFIIYSPENSKEVFIRCYMKSNQFKQTNSYYETNILPLDDNIRNVIVRGVKDIISTAVIDVVKHLYTSDNRLELKKVYGIATVGSNLPAILSNVYIDPYRTQSDSIEETERVFGITAARNKIINEIMIAFDSANRLHCTLFADEMTYSGSVTSIQKTGLQKREMANIMLRLSFQTPISVIQSAAISGMVDRISNISGPLIMGTNPSIGSTYNKLVVNEEFVSKNMANIDSALADL